MATLDAGGDARPARGRVDLLLLALALLAAPVLYLFFAGGGDAGLVVLAVAGLGAAGLATRYPAIGLVGMATLATTNLSDNLIEGFGAPSIAKLAAPGLALILASRWLVNRERPLLDAQVVALFGLYGLVMGLSALQAQSWTVSIDRTVDYGKDLVVVLLTLAFFGRAAAVRIYVWTAIAGLSVICVLCLYQYVVQDFSDDFAGFARILYVGRRLSGPINDPNFFGATLVFFIPLLVRETMMGNGRGIRVLGAALLALFVTALLLTQSRGGLLALGCALGLFVFVFDRRTLLFAAGVAAVLAAVAVALLSDELMTRFEVMFSSLDDAAQADQSIEGRLASWQVAIELFFQNPLLGVGSGNYNLHFQDTALELGLIFRGEGRSAHSLYLEILAELGIVGLAVFVILAGAALVGCVRAMRRLEEAGLTGLRTEYAAFGIGLVGYLIAMVFLHDSYPRLLYTLMAVAIAMPRIVTYEIARRAEPSQTRASSRSS